MYIKSNFFCPKRLTFHPANICYKTLKPALALDKSLDRLFSLVHMTILPCDTLVTWEILCYLSVNGG